jgi:pSer/pThr/pTyr-binding forkhead associated (FHA) protein
MPQADSCARRTNAAFNINARYPPVLTITDLGSTNGTTLNDSDDRLPEGEETPLIDGDRIHVGAWTTITIRRN